MPEEDTEEDSAESGPAQAKREKSITRKIKNASILLTGLFIDTTLIMHIICYVISLSLIEGSSCFLYNIDKKRNGGLFMKKLILILMILAVCVLSACASKNENVFSKNEVSVSSSDTESSTDYIFIVLSPEEAKEMMEKEENIIILDVREKDEYKEGHIEGAIQLSYLDIEKKASKVLPDKNQIILVYCRSGNRSKIASETLVNLGYTNIYEFGGIIDWPYDIVK